MTLLKQKFSFKRVCSTNKIAAKKVFFGVFSHRNPKNPPRSQIITHMIFVWMPLAHIIRVIQGNCSRSTHSVVNLLEIWSHTSETRKLISKKQLHQSTKIKAHQECHQVATKLRQTKSHIIKKEQSSYFIFKLPQC